MAPPGLRPWAPRVPPGIGCRLPDGLRAPPSGGMKHRCAGEVRRPYGRHFLCRLWQRKPDNRAFAREKTIQPPCGRGNAFPLWCLTAPPSPRRMLIITYDTESKSRNADFISIAAERQSTTLGPKGRRPLSASEHNPPPSGGHNPRDEVPSTLTCAFCIECASQPKLALSLPIKGPSYCRLTVRRRVPY